MYAVEMRHVTKSFGDFKANDNVDFCVKKGHIHSLLGENGAGKSTLMNILYGLYKMDGGEIIINGERKSFNTPKDAIAAGISMVHQHFKLIDALSVAENVVIGDEPRNGIFFDREKACEIVQGIADRYGMKVNARDKVRGLPVGVKQRVEILKTLYQQADILIFDEPTAVLTPQEVTELFSVLHKLKSDGKTIIIITHKLKETLEIADEITVLRKGKHILTQSIKGVDEAKLAELMVGRLISFTVDKKEINTGKEALRLEDLTVVKDGKPLLDKVNFSVRYGEILGFAGVEGNGQTELIDCLSGLQKPDAGNIYMENECVTDCDAHSLLEKGIAYIPEDRNDRGIVGDFSISENLILGYHEQKRYQNKGFLNRNAIKQFALESVEQYDIRCSSIDLEAGSMSGGNQQKLIIGRVLAHNPKIVLAAQPTRGVDIGAIEYIHQQLINLKDEGKCVILISADLDEVVKLSDRIAVIYEGKIMAIKDTKEYSEKNLSNLMLGVEEVK